MDERIITIPAEYLSMGYPINIYKPLYKDFSNALKLYPGETRENPQGPGYTFEEFFTALCLRNALGREIDNRPKDAIERFNEMELEDKQFICRTFITAFMMDQDEQASAEALGDSLLASDTKSLSYTILKDQLPFQSHDFTFNRVGGAVQLYVNKNYTSAKVNGCLWEELLFACCLTHVDGEPIDRPPNYIGALGDFELLDIQYCAATFYKMFSLSLDKRKAAVSLGKTWRTTLGTDIVPLTKPKNTSRAKNTEVSSQSPATLSPVPNPGNSVT